VNQRWYYDPVALQASVRPGPDVPSILRQCDAILSSASLLHPRASWMLDDDARPDAQADQEWRQANHLLLGNRSSATPVALSDGLLVPPLATPALLSDLRLTISHLFAFGPV
jgi:hypothetical protein